MHKETSWQLAAPQFLELAKFQIRNLAKIFSFFYQKLIFSFLVRPKKGKESSVGSPKYDTKCMTRQKNARLKGQSSVLNA